ncbi:MAG: 2-dehydropantoate 2-reductase [Fretibacterium sp.]|nr:2-dehydropantoate 2-reductase [Fretibacterium sp.]
MNSKIKIAVFGIGGVGGLLGGALARVHPETYFLARGENLKAIQQNGLSVHSSQLGNFTACPGLASDNAADLGVMDVVILACKGYHLEEACRAAAPMLRPDTLVVPLLNGVLVSEIMKPLLPPCTLADGVIYVFSHLEGPGRVEHTSRFCRVILGMKDGSCPSALKELADLLNRAGVEARLSEEILAESWRKYVRVCSMGVMCCYYDGPAGKARRDPEYKKVLRGAVDSMIAVAAARGVRLPEELAGQVVEAFDKMPPEEVTSLYRDLSSGKPVEQTELRHLIGRMVEMGRELGVPTPYHEAACEKFMLR